MKKMISIVVPVYKVEEYIEKCVNSLLDQTYKNIEIILVNDGSPDKCPDICDMYSEEYSQIKVIHKENGGLSDARNVGLNAANGEYVMFVDSDDYIDLNTCELFLDTIGSSKPDIVVGNAKRIEGTSITEMKHKYETQGRMVTGEEYLKEELKSQTMYMPVWLNLYRRSFLKENNLEFKVGILHEDEQFTPRAFLKAKSVIGTDILFYNYLIRDGSITMQKDLSRNAVHLIQTCYELEYIYKKVADDELRAMLYDNLITKYLYAFQIGRLYRSEYRELIRKDFMNKEVYHKKTKLKVRLFCFNDKLYYKINSIEKKMRRVT